MGYEKFKGDGVVPQLPVDGLSPGVVDATKDYSDGSGAVRPDVPTVFDQTLRAVLEGRDVISSMDDVVKVAQAIGTEAFEVRGRVYRTSDIDVD